ncbi:MAG: class I SAM-dependent methyltransferase [Alphaproteobacteria bacterium]|nr:class I SAM-dependent methyltransferase [Alphaproteobacteria bacterium]
MQDDTSFENLNEVKADMNHIYNQTDPRHYFRELNKLDYAIPDTAKPIFQSLIGHLQRNQDDMLHVLDLGCSYGVNAAILKHDLSMDDLYDHWGQAKMKGATSDQVVADDQRFFADIDNPEEIMMIGLDQAENAIEFGVESGLLDEGIVANLETEPLSATARKTLGQVDLVISTGCVGYLTQKSFDRFLPAFTEGSRPWLANFVLRLFPFDAIEESLGRWGYVTEKLEGETFFQREFVSDDEQEKVLEQLRDQGIDPTGKEDEGHFLAELYLSRPMADVDAMPLERLFPA